MRAAAAERTGARNRREPRTDELEIALSKEEKKLLTSVAYGGGQFTATWARDTLLSAALKIHNQRHLID